MCTPLAEENDLTRATLGFGLIAAALVLGCTAQQPPDASDPAFGKTLYDENCAICHGTEARGDGPGGVGLTPPPPNLRLLASRNSGVFDSDYVMSTIFTSPSEDIGPMPAFAHRDLGDLIIVEEDGLGTPVFTNLLAISSYLETLQD